MTASPELARAFSAQWNTPTPVGAELEARLVALCASVHRELAARDPELAAAVDNVELVGALAMNAPSDGVVAYLDACHPVELALARAACRGHEPAIAAIEGDHHGMIEGLCWRYANATYSAADLRQILREKLFVGSQPKLAEYSGHGRLDSWLRVTAVRTFMDLGKRKDRVREASSDDRELVMPDPADLSLEVIKAEYRAAVRAALHDAAAGLEPADRHGETATCDSDCTPAECGDGTVNATAGEVCDPPDGVTCNDACLPL